MSAKVLEVKTDEDVQMIFEPVRKNIMLIYLHADNPMTSKEVAIKLGEAPSRINYHIKKLVEYGALYLHHTKSINGIIAKYYSCEYEHIMFKVGDLSSEVYLSQSSLLEEIYERVVREFREDLHTHLNMVANSSGNIQRQIASQKHIMYMTKEEQADFIETVENMIKKYTVIDETKEAYSILHAMARIK